jgi:2-polyprenyl-3-methyl-5-hydroxy-6-metoxy-1,4-benzoquinol methylase
MIARAKAKAEMNRQRIRFEVMDAAFPQFSPKQFDVVICRHLLWALPDPDQVLHRWATLLMPTGHLTLIEGYWHTGGGLHAEDVIKAMPNCLHQAAIHNLSDQPKLWGGQVADERYAIVASA